MLMKSKKKHLNVGDELMFRWEVTKQLLDTINNANVLKEEIAKYRKKIGSIDFDFPETVVEFDEKVNLLVSRIS